MIFLVWKLQLTPGSWGNLKVMEGNGSDGKVVVEWNLMEVVMEKKLFNIVFIENSTGCVD